MRFEREHFQGIVKLQGDVSSWSRKNFGDQPSEYPLIGISEEVGELCHSHLKKCQGIRNNEDHEAGIVDALGDVIIYMADYADRVGVDLATCIATAANEALERDWTEE